MPNKDEGPFLTMAVFCDRVIEGKDSVLSIIRVVDRVDVTIPPDAQQPFKVPIAITLVIGFRAGSARGAYILRLEVDTPTGKTSLVGETPISFQGPGEQAANLLSNLQLLIEGEGLYWFNVYLEKEFITRVPLRVAHLAQDPESVKTMPSDDRAASPDEQQETTAP